MLFVPTRNERHSLRWLHGTPQPPKYGGQKNLPTLPGFHIAINKIHPMRYTLHDPFNAYFTLGQLCEKLEIEYGLQPDNHNAKKVISENKTQDMECHAGVESLLGWIKRQCQPAMLSADSWEAMHQIMQQHGLELKERGNGLIISDQNGLTVKASSVTRDLSKAKLESKLGSFIAASSQQQEPPAKHYPRPKNKRKWPLPNEPTSSNARPSS